MLTSYRPFRGYGHARGTIGAGMLSREIYSGYPTTRAIGRMAMQASRNAYNAVMQQMRAKKFKPQKKAVYKPKKVKSFPKSVKSQIKELKRLAESDMGTHIQRRRFTGRALSSVNGTGIADYDLSSITLLEEVIAQLRYYNPSAPSTLVTADGATGTYQKEFLFQKVSHKVLLRNNYQTPCKVQLCLIRSKEDTSISCATAFTNGLADVGNPSSSSPLIYLTDSVQFNDLYKIVSSKNVVLNPGQELVVNHSDKPFQYDPSLVDSHALTYQRKYCDLQVWIKVQGIIGHDTVANEQTNIAAGVDIETISTFVVKYSAGADIKYIHIDDEADTAFTNAGVVSQIVVDNQSYSQA